MRIISGWARGRKLSQPAGRDLEIRPTADRAKEALFSIITARIAGSDVLDLFAGTGALGLEALSRGARSATFIDCGTKAIELITANTAICLPPNTPPPTIIRHDLRRGLPKNLLRIGPKNGYTLIFIDPPYCQGLALQTLELLVTGKFVAPNGLIVVEERRKVSLPEQVGNCALIDQRNYGDTGFWLYTIIPPFSPAEDQK